MSRGGQTYYYFYDALGSVRQLTNATGTVVESYDYDVYGRPLNTSTVGNPVMFTGRWYDSESTNYYYRSRYYSPTLGRFLQRDPVGYLTGMNLYVYVHNNPINYLDPWGTDTYYINNQFNSSNPTDETLYSHSFVAITEINQYGKEVVIKTFSWTNINKGSWQDVYDSQNLSGAQKAIDSKMGVVKVGDSTLDPYIEQVFESYKNQAGGYSLTGNSCKNQALNLIEESQFRLKINKIKNK